MWATEKPPFPPHKLYLPGADASERSCKSSRHCYGINYTHHPSRKVLVRAAAGDAATALSAGSRPEGYNKEAVIREAGMCSRLVNPRKPFPWVRVALLVVLTLLLSGWTTCTAIFSFNSCPSTVPQPVIISLSPDTIPDDTESDPLTVEGSSFVPQSQIMWNGNALRTTFADSRHLQAMITKQTLDSFGGSTGSSVQISVMSPESSLIAGCPNGLSSATLALLIN